MDINEVLSLYEASKNSGDEDVNPRQHMLLNNKNVLIAGFFCLIIVCILIIGYPEIKKQVSYFFSNQPPDIADKLERNAIFSNYDSNNLESNEKPTSPNQVADIIKKNNRNLNNKKTNHFLELTAIETTWLKITTDDEAPKEYILNPGDKLSLNAQNKFNLLLGNSRGVSIMLNNEKIKIPNNLGRVVTLSLP